MQRKRIRPQTPLEASQLKSVVWVGSSRRDLKEFPRNVQREVGYALDKAQQGKKSDKAKPLHGFSGAGVLEIVDDFQGDTYRAVYTVRLTDFVFVLHCFQKKANRGIETPKRELDLIRDRLREAELLHAELRREMPKS